MTIRSIDMQVLVQRVADVSKLQNTQQIQNSLKHQENVLQALQETEVNSKTVNKTKEAESKKVREEDKDKEKQEQSKQKRTFKRANKETDTEHSGIDILA